jgi:hypothetical protein
VARTRAGFSLVHQLLQRAPDCGAATDARHERRNLLAVAAIGELIAARGGNVPQPWQIDAFREIHGRGRHQVHIVNMKHTLTITGEILTVLLIFALGALLLAF